MTEIPPAPTLTEVIRGESHSIRRYRTLQPFLRENLIVLFQPIYDVGATEPIAVEGLVRGAAGSQVEQPEKLFQLTAARGATLGLEQAAYRATLVAFAELDWPGKLFLNVLPGSLMRSARLPKDLRRAIKDAGLHPSQIVLELTEHDPILNIHGLLRLLDPFMEEGSVQAGSRA